MLPQRGSIKPYSQPNYHRQIADNNYNKKKKLMLPCFKLMAFKLTLLESIYSALVAIEIGNVSVKYKLTEP